jgi:hypothetical protein
MNKTGHGLTLYTRPALDWSGDVSLMGLDFGLILLVRSLSPPIRPCYFFFIYTYTISFEQFFYKIHKYYAVHAKKNASYILTSYGYILIFFIKTKQTYFFFKKNHKSNFSKKEIYTRTKKWMILIIIILKINIYTEIQFAAYTLVI